MSHNFQVGQLLESMDAMDVAKLGGSLPSQRIGSCFRLRRMLRVCVYALVLVAVLLASIAVANAEVIATANNQVTVHGRVGDGFYSITTDQSDSGQRYYNQQPSQAYHSRRHCERSLNYDRGHEERRSQHSDILIQCQSVRVRASEYTAKQRHYKTMWMPIALGR